VTYDEETLMAYADGELDEAQRSAIAAAIERDPSLARRVECHRALRASVAGAFAKVADQPVPERLVAAANAAVTDPNAAGRSAKVLSFPTRSAAPAPRWRAREWSAMAASLVLGVLVSWKLLAPEPLIDTGSGALVARGALATALDRQLASTQRESDPVQIGVSFRGNDGQYCRSFALKDAGTAGLACRADGEWHVAVTAAGEASDGGVRQAASPPAAVLQAIEARMAGDALDAADEERAQRDDWKPARR
jgi:hypothetical protein